MTDSDQQVLNLKVLALVSKILCHIANFFEWYWDRLLEFWYH